MNHSKNVGGLRLWPGDSCAHLSPRPGSPSQVSYENITMADTSCGLNIFHSGGGGGGLTLNDILQADDTLGPQTFTY